jgi:hypothetical protein
LSGFPNPGLTPSIGRKAGPFVRWFTISSTAIWTSFIRFEWALTEDCPEIKAYFEERWAELGDYPAVPVAVSLALLESLHQRWVGLLRSLGSEDLKREFVHSETGSATDLAETIGAYAWHGRHHLAHIEKTIHREGWTP